MNRIVALALSAGSSLASCGMQYEKCSENVPVSFVYAGRAYRGLGELRDVKKSARDTALGKAGELTGWLDDAVRVRLETAWTHDEGALEYTLWFENTSTRPSKLLENVHAVDKVFVGEAPRVRGILGDHGAQYRPYDRELAAGCKPVEFVSDKGSATHFCFPYFDLVHGEGGMLIALGWPGTWRAVFTPEAGGARLVAESCLNFASVLAPGERMRTARVAFVPYRGRDIDHASNVWRAWYRKAVMPKANAKGEPLKPLLTSNFAFDAGRPNSDGSIAEGHDTWRRTLDRLVAERVVPDFRWLDAGWYSAPDGRSSPSDWRGTVGSWIVDPAKWPGRTLRDSVDAARAVGAKTMVWFSPEWGNQLETMVEKHGLKREWTAAVDGRYVLDFGNPDCVKWILGRILAMMHENDIDLYREDLNIKPALAWPQFDARDAKALGVPRKGMAENKYFQGHYALWDAILADCAARGKCTYIDSCAGGGGRNDLETMRRAVPFLRSDADRTTLPLRLSMTWGFARWIPFHGTHTKETPWSEHAASRGRGPDEYAFRSSFVPILMYDEAFTHNGQFDFALLRRNIAEWRSVCPLLVRDFYPLTPWHDPSFEDGWTVFAYDAPELGESVVLAMRMPKAAEKTFTAKLKFADPKAIYELKDADTGRARMLSGTDLRERGFAITLDKPRSSALVRIRKSQSQTTR